MLSNVSEPLIGVVNTAVIGQLKDPYYIGAIAVGALIFSFIFWGFSFLRLSTGGLSAQALGAGDRPELAAVLIRALMIAAAATVVQSTTQAEFQALTKHVAVQMERRLNYT
jgi:MATE family multidrug resistance protein